MTTNWMEQNRELFRALKLEQVVTFIVIALIVIVAALNILIALTMMVMEKTRDIAVMMSFGVEPGQVRRIFLLQGLLISVDRHGARPGARLPRLLGRRPLPLHPSFRRGLLHRHPALRAAAHATESIVAAVSIGISLLATLYPSSSAARSAARRGAAVRVIGKRLPKPDSFRSEFRGARSGPPHSGRSEYVWSIFGLRPHLGDRALPKGNGELVFSRLRLCTCPRFVLAAQQTPQMQQHGIQLLRSGYPSSV